MSRGGQLFKLSFSVIRKDKTLLLFPIISFAYIVLIGISFMWPLIPDVLNFSIDSEWWVLFFALGLPFYFIAFVVATFFNVALIGCAIKSIEGTDTTVSYGIRFANSRFRYIAKWALFACTVGLVIKSLTRIPYIGGIVAKAVGAVWGIGSYFALPALAMEELDPIQALKRSTKIIKSTWAETLTGNLGVWWYFGIGACVFYFLMLGILFILIMLHPDFAIAIICVAVLFVVSLIFTILLGVLASTTEIVLLAALYRYAITGEIVPGFPEEILENPWEEVGEIFGEPEKWKAEDW
jgi:hypothetical protein